MTRVETVRDFLVLHGAGELEHPGGTLLEHLLRVGDLLAAWGASEEVWLAGLGHATYGTDGFAPVLLPLSDRDVARGVFGDDAEALIYLYASCDRRTVYRQADQPVVEFLNRFTGESRSIAAPDLAGFWEITFANELDIVNENPAYTIKEGSRIWQTFTAVRPYASEMAWKAFTSLDNF